MATNGLLSNDPTSALIKIAPDGIRTTFAFEGLFLPTGMTIGPDSAIYISNYGVFPGSGDLTGQVIRIDMTPTGVSLSGLAGESEVSLRSATLIPVGLLVLALTAYFWRRQITKPRAILIDSNEDKDIAVG
jgi:hypothetical protein